MVSFLCERKVHETARVTSMPSASNDGELAEQKRWWVKEEVEEKTWTEVGGGASKALIEEVKGDDGKELILFEKETATTGGEEFSVTVGISWSDLYLPSVLATHGCSGLDTGIRSSAQAEGIERSADMS
ncbi:hypothetical protein R1sor_014981 [Riccia sorocarpa]|uniref:Uncharacterized protein n=1 Tax=Riccia sorocarpa TaxID=122646 RepID=A0ABD3HDJ6_9MARC